MENFKGFEDCCLDICRASTIAEREFAGCNVSADQKCCPHSADGFFGCSATGARDARGCNATLCVHERGDTRHHLTHDLFAYRAVCQQALFGDGKNVALNFIGVGNHPSFENLGTAGHRPTTSVGLPHPRDLPQTKPPAQTAPYRCCS